jgi:large subunit ribosomal protein L4
VSASTLSAPYAGSSETAELDPAIFGEELHMALLHEVARADLNARRQGTHSTKDRSEVAMTGAKAFRQKGTGRARAGALSTPQRYGGGVAFGPKPRGYTFKVNRKARRRALRCALSVHAGRGSLALVDPSGFDVPSTKRAAEALAGLGRQGSALLVVARDEDATARSFRNIARVRVRAADQVGVADVIGASSLLLTPAALELVSALARPPRAEVAA